MIILHTRYGEELNFNDDEILYADIKGVKFNLPYLGKLGDVPSLIMTIERSKDTLLFHTYGHLDDNKENFHSLIKNLKEKHLTLVNSKE